MRAVRAHKIQLRFVDTTLADQFLQAFGKHVLVVFVDEVAEVNARSPLPGCVPTRQVRWR